MANMLRNKRRSCRCCGDPEMTAGQARRREQRGWLSDFQRESTDAIPAAEGEGPMADTALP